MWKDELPDEYRRRGCAENELAADPIAQFRLWYDDARENSPGGWFDVNAMALATCDDSGHPTCRIVLLKQADESGFVFFTNYESRKAAQLARHGSAALTVFLAARQSAGPHRRFREPNGSGHFDRLFSKSPARKPAGSTGVAAVPRHFRTRGTESGVLGNRIAIRGPADSVSGALGRLSRGPGTIRVLAGARQSTARSVSVPAGERRLDNRASGTVKNLHIA